MPKLKLFQCKLWNFEKNNLNFRAKNHHLIKVIFGAKFQIFHFVLLYFVVVKKCWRHRCLNSCAKNELILRLIFGAKFQINLRNSKVSNFLAQKSNPVLLPFSISLRFNLVNKCEAIHSESTIGLCPTFLQLLCWNSLHGHKKVDPRDTRSRVFLKVATESQKPGRKAEQRKLQ